MFPYFKQNCVQVEQKGISMKREEKNFYTIMQAERKIHFYGGDNCDEEQEYWSTYCDGDMDGEDVYEPLQLCPKTFPAGTIVFIKLPCCPNCEQSRECCEIDDGCEFDWVEWDSQYS